jgi:hypothetical protein
MKHNFLAILIFFSNLVLPYSTIIYICMYHKRTRKREGVKQFQCYYKHDINIIL